MEWESNATARYQACWDDIERACQRIGSSREEALTRYEAAVQGELARRAEPVVTVFVLDQILQDIGAPEAMAGVAPVGAASGPPPLPTPPPLPSASIVAPSLAAHATRRRNAALPKEEGKSPYLLGCSILAVSMVLFIIATTFGMPYLVKMEWEADRSQCAANIAEIGQLVSLHRDPQTGYFPPLAVGQEPFLFGGEAFDQLEVSLLRCPSAWYEEEDEEEILSDADYIYLGYAVRNQSEMDSYIKNYVSKGGVIEEFMAQDRIHHGPTGLLERLRPDLPDAAAIPVLVEWNVYHFPDGGHVYYLDGHVEYLAMEEAFPMTEDFFSSIYDGMAAENLGKCEDNLHGIWETLVAQAEANEQVYPPLSTELDSFIFGGEALSAVDAALLRCPSSGYEEVAGSIYGSDYYYLGYAIDDQEAMDDFVTVYRESGGTNGNLPQGDGLQGLHRQIPRLRMDLPDADTIPILVESEGNHADQGAHVVYLDGHIDFIPYGDKFPVTSEFYEGLNEALDFRHRAQCYENLVALGQLLKAEGEKNEGNYPQIDPDGEPFLFDGELRETMDIKLLRCPAMAYEGESDEDIIYDADYIYLGFAIQNHAELDTYMSIYGNEEFGVDGLNQSDVLSGTAGDIPKLRQDLPNPENIPVLIEWCGFHSASGGHVLYLDGHVEFVSMESKYPMTTGFFDSLYPDAEPESPWSLFWDGVRQGFLEGP